MTNKKLLPYGITDFRELITNNYFYVDKTKGIYNLFNSGIKYYFLSRPRRFGKSILISTIRELFSGNKELFKNCWISSSDFDWQVHPIINFDFSDLDCKNIKNFHDSLNFIISEVARKNNIDVSNIPIAKLKFKYLIEQLAKINRVVILIDEYDKPILDNILNIDIAQEIRDDLASFYSIIKSSGNLIRASFITGITKFSQTSIFSGLNNINDISIDPIAKDLCGYTELEVLENFKEYLTNQSIEQIREWYNGYRFSKDPLKVYNPHSIIAFFTKNSFGNYWWDSGSPTFLIKLIQTQFNLEDNLSMIYLPESGPRTFDIENLDLESVLFQCGYLTIVDYDSKKRFFQLGFPNLEVTQAFYTFLMSIFLNTKNKLSKLSFALKDNLISQELDKFCHNLEILFSNIAYPIIQNTESFYHSIFQVIMTMITMNSRSEIMTNQGRIDLVIDIKNLIYIFEIKLNQTAQIALDQILNKKYYQTYQLKNKEIVLVGINFNTKNNFKIEYTFKKLDNI